MPNERLRHMSRRMFLEVTAGGLAGLVTGCNQTPSARPSPTPQELSITERALLPQRVIEQIEGARNTPTPPPLDTPTPARTPVSIPELTPKPTPRPTPEPVRTPTPEPNRPPSIVWSTDVNSTPFKNTDVQPPAYAGEGNLFFLATSTNEIVAIQVELTQGRQVWPWTNKGAVWGYSGGTVFLFHADIPRLYAIDAKTKEEIWKRNLPNDLFDPYGGFKKGFKRPLLTSQDFVGLVLERGSLILGKRNDYFYRSNYLLQAIEGNIAIVSDFPTGYPPPKYYAAYELSTPGKERMLWQTDVEYAHLDPDGLFAYRQAPGRPGDPRNSRVTKHDLKTGNPVWTQEFEPWSTPSYSAGNMMAVGRDIGTYSTIYSIVKKDTGSIIDKLQSQSRGLPYSFCGNDSWFFASHQEEGTTAYFAGKKVWENDEILYADEFIGEFDNVLILARSGRLNPFSSRTPRNGIVWGLTKDGKKFVWPPPQFAEMTATRHIVNGKLIVADEGRNGEARIHSIDIKSGKKLSTNLTSGGVRYLTVTNLDGVLVGQSGYKFFVLRV